MAEETEITIGGIVYKVPDDWTADQLRDYINNRSRPDLDGLTAYGAIPQETPEIEIVDIPSISSILKGSDPRSKDMLNFIKYCGVCKNSALLFRMVNFGMV